MAEIYCILYRLDPSQADETCRALSHIGLTILPIEDDDLWRTAAKIKAQHSLSLADAFAVATAERKKSTLVVGSDKEFDGLTVRFLKQENNPTKIETNLLPQDQTNTLENLTYNRADNSNIY
jgi:hypothetical protein